MAQQMRPSPSWLRANSVGRPVGVDREAKVLRGYVVAQAGPFKSDGRGEFDRQSLDAIVSLGNAESAGLKSRFTHPDMSNDGLGKFLGRAKEFSLGKAIDARSGQPVEAVRADLHFDSSASKTPSGDLAAYVMDLAESDPDALSSSLVLRVKREYRLDEKGQRKTDDNGEELPPLWRPTELHSSDVVDTGDAVDGILSPEGIEVDGLPLGALWRGAELLDNIFEGQSRDAVEARCRAFLDRYLSRRFGDAQAAGRATNVLRRRLRSKLMSRAIGH
jgi:hypothetical protein